MALVVSGDFNTAGVMAPLTVQHGWQEALPSAPQLQRHVNFVRGIRGVFDRAFIKV